MSLQSIINAATAIQIDRKKVLGSTISRAGHLKTAERPTARTYMITVTFDAALPYAANRDLIEELDRLDRSNEEQVNIGISNTGLSWITAYQGDMSANARATANLVVALSGSNVILNATSLRSAGVSNTAFVARAGDYISFGANAQYRYPYTVTTDVVLGTDANVTLPLHRPLIPQTGFTITGNSMRWGSDVTWSLKMYQKPSYVINPGRLITFDGDFQLIEVIT